MAELRLLDLVRNRTLAPGMAATLATAAAERRSLLFVAIPRLAGKTTTMMATLAHAPSGTSVHPLSREAGAGLGIPEDADGGYLLLAEIADVPFAEYLWGDPVRRVFGALDRGFSLATALHAPGVDEAFEVICAGNRVPDEQAARIGLVLYIRSLGDWRAPTRRVAETLFEVDAVEGGRPRGRVLYRWLESEDRFEAVEPPAHIGAEDGGLERRTAEFARALDA
ncbi:MAG: hypothetical protein GEU80_08250 [Dehalococcoidia bacterium]|nr:hypothetical protein [Dehalococcoidia bacterium]